MEGAPGAEEGGEREKGSLGKGMGKGGRAMSWVYTAYYSHPRDGWPGTGLLAGASAAPAARSHMAAPAQRRHIWTHSPESPPPYKRIN